MWILLMGSLNFLWWHGYTTVKWIFKVQMIIWLPQNWHITSNPRLRMLQSKSPSNSETTLNTEQQLMTSNGNMSVNYFPKQQRQKLPQERQRTKQNDLSYPINIYIPLEPKELNPCIWSIWSYHHPMFFMFFQWHVFCTWGIWDCHSHDYPRLPRIHAER